MESLKKHSILSPPHPSTRIIYPFIHPYHHGSWSHEVAGQHSWAPSLCLKTTSNGHGWVTQKGGSWLPRMLTQSSHPILGFCVAPDKGTAYIWISVPLSGLYILITRILLILFHRQPIIIFIFHSSPTTNVHHQLYIHLSTFPLFLYSLEDMPITGSHTSSQGIR